MTWQGDDGGSPTDWNTEANWDLGIVPQDVDTAIIPNVANDPILLASINVENLTIEAGGVLYLNGNDLTVDDELSNDGVISAEGDEVTTVANWDFDSGTVIYTGNDDGVADNFNIAVTPSPYRYYNLEINDV